MNDYNQPVIDEFRANEGQLGGQFAGAPMLLLHHRGAKTGTERVSPVMYRPVANGYAVFASKAGAPTNPGWYHNLRANAATTVEVGTETVPVTARVAAGDERERLWSDQTREYPGFAEYEAKAGRQIPVVILERA